MIKLNFDVKRHILNNGLEVITINKDSQIAAINLGVKVGALYENMAEKGISHFIEHTVFKGTETRNDEQLNEELEALGGEYNAYTDYDVTVYTISCLMEEFENAVELLGDMIINPKFEAEEIEKERGVILSEIKTSKDDIEDFSFKNVNKIAFNESPLKYEVIGLEENVSRFTRDEIKSYYDKYYTPKNSVISIVSALSHEDAIRLVEEKFKEWNGEKPEPLKMIKESNKEIIKVSYKKDIEQSTMVYLYTFNELGKGEELPLRILNHRLGESSNSLLFREIREKRGLAYDIYTHLEITKNIKTLYIYTAVSEENIDETKEAIDKTLKDIVDGKIEIGDKDLQIMKKVHKTAVISTLEDSAELCNYMLHQALEDEDIFEFVKDMDRLNNLDTAKISEVSKIVLKNPTIHILKSN
ncbi:M16 family metallopeptidase [Clostridium saccharoperbutylacetonicum]|uniref:Putative zinc-dependent protease n=1 Tax=Clostridium saccharoperbutylacetonicum N1-4(HMT) TaxID=931276 RepID=M1MNZ6_9CLOT|nr:pitrilysin family protein [Clostridium saccharoperbutylacetonicum]AGF57933.1 putative zinc-dependent protease [Clostridium saccharoperbutylacetonicum N1-4(HMT)]AQR96608.1 protease 3 precursor [Clostridium saccharoperbutylacetonicum]NRT61294.1 putative Zn-dependent peptidase [Clostridium saccharoperbutylacetonicum]NSB24611.1 putative Zn-dependent peptidase [Clostridium saccharoperbutylacetonicum]NSB32484.1 putative Zn-dependent peptidase [Clostridium saccharoperbutylacetonicum]